MCKHEIIGDFYRGCGHFHGRYYTGDFIDCGDAQCKNSAMHKHKSAANCGCTDFVIDDRKIQNMFQLKFPDCKEGPPNAASR